MINGMIISLQVVLGFMGIYQFGLSIFGWVRKEIQLNNPPTKTFAVIVAAYNEQNVIGALLENLKQLNYPKEMYDIYVICDNCTDQTAQIVRSMGVGVYACERFNPNKRGKGHAIEWMLERLWEMPRKYDAIAMFDADNLVHSDCLLQFNQDLCTGSRVIQGYLDTKNPTDSWVSVAYGITYWYCNRMWQLPRKQLNMANFLGGTGMCFETKLLKEFGWGATSLVEDLEFTMRCIQHNIYPTFNYQAIIYDEKPITLAASMRQRLRWMQGHFDIARKYFFPLMKQAVIERNWIKVDAALYSMNAYNVLLGLVLTLVLWIDQLLPGAPMPSLYYFVPGWLATLVFIIVYIQVPFALLLEKVRIKKVYVYLMTFPVFILSWIPIAVYAFFTQNNKTWSHTEHTRVLRLEDLQKN